jgi:flagellar basal body L-ring protein FlgH
MRLLFNIILIHLLVGCANYINSIHRQIDREEKLKKDNRVQTLDPYSIYRESSLVKRGDKRPISNPNSYSQQPNMIPANNRNYDNAQVRNRYRAKDLVDNDNSTSLWAGDGRDSFLYSQSDKKQVGDIIVLNVLEKFKNDISNELKRVFPPPKKATKPDDKNAPAAAATTPAAPDENKDQVQLEGNDSNARGAKIYDKISTQVVEEVSGDYVLIKGKKEVVFRDQKHLLEIQALVSRRDIFDGDKVESDKVLESRIFVVR